MEGRGQTSWGFPKKPYNVETRDVYDQDMNVSLLGLPAESDYALFNDFFGFATARAIRRTSGGMGKNDDSTNAIT